MFMLRMIGKKILLLLLLVNITYGGLLSFKIQPRVQECFYEEIKYQKSAIDLEYEVIEGGDLDIGISIVDSRKQTILHKVSNFDVRRGGKSDPEQVHLVNLRHGIYEICFDNIMVSRDYKVLVIYTTDHREEKFDDQQGEKLAEKSELEKLESLAVNLQGELNKLERLQRYTQRRLHRHLWTQESTASRRSWFTMLQMIIVVIVAIGQTVYIKAWFQKRETSFRV
eukprot:UN00080